MLPAILIIMIAAMEVLLAVGASPPQWATIPGLRYGRAAHASKLFNGSMYVVGGIGDDGATPTDSVEVRCVDDLADIIPNSGAVPSGLNVNCSWRPAKPLLAPVFGHKLAQYVPRHIGPLYY